MNDIVSKDLILQQADAAAARWAMNPSAEKPENPYSADESPEAHALWKREFEVALGHHSAEAINGRAQ